jgi:hypothetical protein
MAKKTIIRHSTVSGEEYVLARTVGRSKRRFYVHKPCNSEAEFVFRVTAFVRRLFKEHPDSRIADRADKVKIRVVSRLHYIAFPDYGVKYYRNWGIYKG